jgi:N-acetylneuraminic acid mutarotase
MNGPKTAQLSSYGTLGVPAAANLPGVRYSAANWTDSKGNLWLFGGFGSDSVGYWTGDLNDLWEYSPSTNQWAWMGGSSTLTSAGGPALGVPGTLGVPATGNIPVGRAGAVSWTDTKGNVWLFGGSNYSGTFNYFNDLWEFNPSTNQWAWMSGVSTESCTQEYCSQPGVYGKLGVAAVGNVPGSRSDALSWTDSKGNLWLFGGYGFDSANRLGDLNDLWEFNPSTNEWAWMGGSTTIPTNLGFGNGGQSGVYGTMGAPDPANIPGGRSSPSGWTDSKGNLWLFGGFGSDSAGTFGSLNDLWEFSPSTNQWEWVGGGSTYPANCYSSNSGRCGMPAIYGTLAIPGTGNVPGGRAGAANWTDSKGNFWLFGGNGIDSTSQFGYLNDFWEYSPSTNQWTWMSGSATLSCPTVYCGQSGVYGISQTSALGNTPNSRENSASWADGNGDFWLFGGMGIDVVGDFDYFQDLWEFQPNTAGSLPVAATPTFSPGGGTYTTQQTIAIYDNTPGATISYLINGNTPASVYTAPLTVSSSESIEAIAGASGYANSDIATAAYTANIAAAAAPTFSPVSGTYAMTQTVTLSDATPGTTIYYTTDQSMPTTASAVYKGPIAVSSPETILAVAVANGFLNSPTASAVYTVGPTSTLGEWAWMGGSTSPNQPGVYGLLLTPSPTSSPGARNGSTSWTDQNGNFWLFGGAGYDENGNDGVLNDLWEFNPSLGEWAWMSGNGAVPSPCSIQGECGQPGIYGTLATRAPGHIPGGRTRSAGWTDSGGHQWLFGGYGIDAKGQLGQLNDLWEFDTSSNEWTWMGGSSNGVLSSSSLGQPGIYGTLGTPSVGNIPGSRSGAASWTDDKGNFWLFGGAGEDGAGNSVTLNDLWEFNPSTMEWAWMGGSDVVEILVGHQPPVYGTLGVPSTESNPGSLSGAASWTDGSGNLWLLGNGAFWRFSPSINEWAWMGGAGTSYCPVDPLIGGYNVCVNPPAVVGTLGLPAAGNFPSVGNPAWTDQAGNFWLFGGNGSDVTGENNGFYRGGLDSMWVYNPSTNEWAWMGGDYAASNCSFIVLDPLADVICDGSQGVFGSKSVPAPGNTPSARVGGVTWIDKFGNLWLFSGLATNLSDNSVSMNDLWEYQPSMSTLPPAATPIFSLKSGLYSSGGSLTISNGMPNASIYYSTGANSPGTGSTLYSGPITLSNTKSFQAIATAPGYRNSAVAHANYTFASPPATPVFSLASGTYTSVQMLTISDATPGVMIYYTTDGSPITSSSPVYAGPITVSSPETITAVALFGSVGYLVFDGIAVPGDGVLSPVATATYVVNLPPAAAPTFSVPSGTYTTAPSVTISDATPGAAIYYSTGGTTPTVNSNLYSGPITISFSETIEAIAVANGYANSPVASASYVISPPPTFAFGAAPNLLTVNSGAQGTVLLTVTPRNGFNSAVSFACSGLPAGVSCSFSPGTVTPAGSASNSTLTISVSAQAAASRPDSRPLFPTAALVVAGCLIARTRRRSFQIACVVILAFVGLGLLTSCGGVESTPSSTSMPVTSTISVTAMSGSIQQTAFVTLTLN